MRYWGLATLKPMCEKVATANLDAQGFAYYNPQIEVSRIKRGKEIITPEQLFPGYLFVEVNDRFRSLFGTKGIANVVMAGEWPSLIRDQEIDFIKSREVNGFVVLDKNHHRFKKGQAVKASGVIDGRVMIYEGTRKGDRVKVLFEMLGQAASIFVRETDLVAA